MQGINVKSKIIRCLFAGFFLFLIFIFGICLGGYRAFEMGYREGKKDTNTWWIDKQSRNYESDEVESKRRDRRYDHI